MKLTVKTSTLQDMVAKSMKCASCSKMLPLTNLMAIQLVDNTLMLITTDATNYLCVKEDKIVGDDFYAVVPAEIFSKLVSRLTCESVKLSISNDILYVEGNGKYSIELPLNEDGELIKYPLPKEVEFTESGKINLSTIQLVLTTAKSSLSVTDDIPCYTGYYVGNKIVTTDTLNMCAVDIKLFDTPSLLYATTMPLLGIFTDEIIEYKKNDQVIEFVTSTCSLRSNLMDCIADYKIDAIEGLLDEQSNCHCSVNKSVLIQLLDRLSLFVTSYDRSEIMLKFTSSGLYVDSKTGNSVELIPYVTSENFTEFSCKVNIELFRVQVKSVVGENVEIYYGNETAIKFHRDNITQLIALQD